MTGIPDQVFEGVMHYTGLPGCNSTNPDVCICGIWEDSEIECDACNEPIREGEHYRMMCRAEYPWLDHRDQEWTYMYWHIRCDEVDTETDDGYPIPSREGVS